MSQAAANKIKIGHFLLISPKKIADFRVSIEHEGYSCRVKAEGVANSQWLLKCLSHSFAFKTSDPLISYGPDDFCTFQLAYGSQLSHRGLEALLLAIPGVHLRVEPGSKSSH